MVPIVEDYSSLDEINIELADFPLMTNDFNDK
jgi:hypothetical protein